DERLVAEAARLRSFGGLDETLGFARRQRLRERLRPARQLHCGGGIVVACAEQLLVSKEAAGRCRAAGDRGRSKSVGSKRRRVPLQVLEARPRDRLAEIGG